MKKFPGKVHIIGAGGHCRALVELLHVSGYESLAIYDDTFSPSSDERICGIPISGNEQTGLQTHCFIAGIGSLEKRRYLSTLRAYLTDNIIHPTSIPSQSARIGAANQLFPLSFVGAEAQIGNHNILNTSAIVEHEVEIGSFCHISIGAVIGGRAKIGDSCFIGANATVINNITICDGTTIGAGSLVRKNVSEQGVYAGNPLRRIR